MADTTHADATHADTRRRVRSRPAAEPGPSTGGRLVAPADVAAASTALRDGIGDRATVRFAGNGTKAGWGGALDPIDLTVSTGGLQQVISHNPADMTAAVQAGMPLTRLQSVLAEHGQWLALDPPSAAGGATLGGLLATGDAGPRRLRYGSLRDLAIGATLVLADGTVVHSGSHVIKNVAGYDLTKLFHGSLGSLGLIAEVIVRLHPLPPTSATVLARCSLAEATAGVPELTCGGVEPTAVEWIGPADTDETGTLLVRVDGSAAGVTAASARLAAVLTSRGLAPQVLDPEAAEAQWARTVAAVTGPPDATVIRAGTTPSRLPDVADALSRLADDHAVGLRTASGVAVGLHTAVLTGEPADQAAVITAWRRRVQPAGATVTVRDRPAGVETHLDAVGPPPSAAALMAAVKAQLDPDHRCAPGRFRGWF